jgi:hypothetical protein
MYPDVSKCEPMRLSPFTTSLPNELVSLFARHGCLYLLESPKVKAILHPITPITSSKELKLICLTNIPCSDDRVISSMIPSVSYRIRLTTNTADRILYAREMIMGAVVVYNVVCTPYVP